MPDQLEQEPAKIDEGVPIIEVTITGVKPAELSDNPFTSQYDTIAIDREAAHGEEGKDTELSTSHYNRHQPNWDHEGPFTPQFISYQNSQTIGQTTATGNEEVSYDIYDNRRGVTDGHGPNLLNNCLNGCVAFKLSILLFCGLVAFGIGGYVTKRIADLNQVDRFKEGETISSTPYIMYGLAAFMIFATGIGLIYYPVMAAYESCYNSLHRESRYQHI